MLYLLWSGVAGCGCHRGQARGQLQAGHTQSMKGWIGLLCVCKYIRLFRVFASAVKASPRNFKKMACKGSIALLAMTPSHSRSCRRERPFTLPAHSLYQPVSAEAVLRLTQGRLPPVIQVEFTSCRLTSLHAFLEVHPQGLFLSRFKPATVATASFECSVEAVGDRRLLGLRESTGPLYLPLKTHQS